VLAKISLSSGEAVEVRVENVHEIREALDRGARWLAFRDESGENVILNPAHIVSVREAQSGGLDH
jgi:hypothetical protein